MWSRPFEKDLPVILPACPELPPSSAHCAAVARDGLPNASGMGGLGPKSRKSSLSELDPVAILAWRVSVISYRLPYLYFVALTQSVLSTLNAGALSIVCAFFGTDVIWLQFTSY